MAEEKKAPLDGAGAMTPEQLAAFQVEHKKRMDELSARFAEVERMERELTDKSRQGQHQPQQNDLAQYSDNELLAIITSTDPSHMPYKTKAQETLDDRRFERRVQKKERQEHDKRNLEKLQEDYPWALNPNDEKTQKMNEKLQKMGLEPTITNKRLVAELIEAKTKVRTFKQQDEERKKELEGTAIGRTGGSDNEPPKETDANKIADLVKRGLQDGDPEATLRLMKERGLM